MSTLDNATVLIVNRKARGGYVGQKWPVLEPQIREALGPVQVRFTERQGDGTPLCRSALQGGAALVLAMGGDGTASEVAAGFMDEQGGAAPRREDACFGFLPCGSGGDLRRTFDTPTDLRAAAQAVARARPRRLDLGSLRYTRHDGSPGHTYFINIASCGISGLVDELVNRSSKLLGGTFTFFSASVRATFRYRNQRVRVQLDDGPALEQRIYTLAVANGQYFGGGMRVAPEARPDDGLLDVVTLGDLGVVEALALSGAIYKGEHLQRRKISAARARQVTLTPVDEGAQVLLDVDGETPGRLPATFTVLPGALPARV